MEHSYFKDKISAFKDYALSAEEQQLIEQHLAGCPECRDILAKLESLDKLVQTESKLGSGQYWDQLAGKIDRRIEESLTRVTAVPRGSGWSGLAWKLTATAASVALLVFVGLHKDDILPPAREASRAPAGAPSSQDDNYESELPFAEPKNGASTAKNESDTENFAAPQSASTKSDEKTRTREVLAASSEAVKQEQLERAPSVGRKIGEAKPGSPTLEHRSGRSKNVDNVTAGDAVDLDGALRLNKADRVDRQEPGIVEDPLEEDNYRTPLDSPESLSSTAAGNRLAATLPMAQITEPVVETFPLTSSVVSDSLLKRWRAERDSLLDQWPQMAAGEEDFGSQLKRKREAIAKTAVLDIQGFAENEEASGDRLLTVLRQLITYSPDNSEVEAAVGIIGKLQQYGSSGSRRRAKAILDSLSQSRSVDSESTGEEN